MDFFDVPTHAIDAFENIHDLRVTIHDLTGTLWFFLPPDRFQHSAANCQAVKHSAAGAKCLAFEGSSLREALVARPQGRVHVCHAGFVEWVVPVFGGDALMMVLFAGIRAPGRDLPCDVRPRRMPKSGPNPPPTVDEAQSQSIHEHLRQLAARIKQWMDELPSLTRADKATARTDTQRQVAIRSFIMHRHTDPVRLADLANALGLSEGRTSHVVRQSCGRSFRQLLIEARVRTAMGLLRHTDTALPEVAARSGFDDLRHFHRQFKKAAGQTPHRYRAMHE
jgi:AraC-like DNA-binding protein